MDPGPNLDPDPEICPSLIRIQTPIWIPECKPTHTRTLSILEGNFVKKIFFKQFIFNYFFHSLGSRAVSGEKDFIQF